MNDRLQLGDGAYEVLVVEASADGDAFVIELTIISGDHKGDVVGVRAAGLVVDELDLLGLPGMLHVENGVPHFELDR